MSTLSRRKYCELVRLLKSVLASPSHSIRVKMQAAARLDGIYARHEEQVERALARTERAVIAAMPATVAPTSPAIPLSPEERERLEDEAKDLHTAQIFAAVLGKGKGGDNAAR